MSTAIAHNFLVLSQTHRGIQTQLSSVRSVDEIMKIAQHHGFAFSERDFNTASYQYDDDSMNEVELESLLKVGKIDPTYCGRSCSQKSTKTAA